MASMCQFHYLIDNTTSIWCKFFDPSIVRTFNYKEDLVFACYFIKYQVSRLMACDLFKDLLSKLRDISSPKATTSRINLYFGSMLSVYNVLGIGFNGDYPDLNYKSIDERHPYNGYWLSILDPMNANLAFVVYKCRRDRFKVRVFLNENLIKLNGCSEKDCDLNKFFDYYQNYLNKCQSTQISCQI